MTSQTQTYVVDRSETTGNWNVYTADKSGIAAGPFYTKDDAEDGKRELEAGRRMLNYPRARAALAAPADQVK